VSFTREERIEATGGIGMAAEVDKFVDKCVALWNESDDDIRRGMIKELWADGGAHFAGTIEARGIDEIEKRVASAYGEFVGTGGFKFVRGNISKGLQNAVMYDWNMVPVSGGKVAASGTVFMVLNEDKLIQFEYQF